MYSTVKPHYKNTLNSETHILINEVLHTGPPPYVSQYVGRSNKPFLRLQRHYNENNQSRRTKVLRPVVVVEGCRCLRQIHGYCGLRS